MSKVTLTEAQIKQIAEGVDTSANYYINPVTGEIEEMMADELLEFNDIFWEEDEEEDADRPEWQREMRTDVKKQMEKINSWKEFIKIEKPQSHEYFEIMEAFVDQVIPDGKLKNDFWYALGHKKPFARFKAVVHNCKYREDWFVFKQKMLMDWVRRELGMDDE